MAGVLAKITLLPLEWTITDYASTRIRLACILVISTPDGQGSGRAVLRACQVPFGVRAERQDKPRFQGLVTEDRIQAENVRWV